MSILEIIKKRRSIRALEKREIPKEVLEELKEALIWAPSAGNLQSRKFYFIFNEKIKKQLVEEAGIQDFVLQAPLVIIGCCDLEKIAWYGKRGINLYSICDVSTSIENLMIMATEKGLGTCWVGTFDERKVSEILNLSKNLRPIVIVPVGFPSEKPSAPPRVSVGKAVEVLK